MEDKVVQDEDRSYCVYVHTNKINGKQYVGQTCREKPEYRWNKDGKGYHRQTHFYSEIQEYGWNNFDTEIVKSNLTSEEANVLEKKLIEEYNTLDKDNGYNLQSGGSGSGLRKIVCRTQSDEINNANNNIPFNERYMLTIDEVCAYTGLSSSTMSNILKNKNNFALWIDNDWYIIRIKLEEYFERCAEFQIDI